MNAPSVSILIVTHNAARYIERTIQSCLQQTYQSTELLILDNASTDETVGIIQRKHDPRIQLHVSKENIGPYAGLNVLLDKAKGEFIAIQDHDDLWRPAKIAEQVAWLQAHQDFIACGTQTFYYFEKKHVLILSPQPATVDFVDHTSLMFRAGTWRYDPAKALPDEYFERRILRPHGFIGCLSEPLTVHRIRGDKKNLSSQRVQGNFRGFLEHLQLTGGRDLPGAALFAFGGAMPDAWLWWLRKHVTLRRSIWLSRQAFEDQYHFTL